MIKKILVILLVIGSVQSFSGQDREMSEAESVILAEQIFASAKNVIYASNPSLEIRGVKITKSGEEYSKAEMLINGAPHFNEGLRRFTSETMIAAPNKLSALLELSFDVDRAPTTIRSKFIWNDGAYTTESESTVGGRTLPKKRGLGSIRGGQETSATRRISEFNLTRLQKGLFRSELDSNFPIILQNLGNQSLVFRYIGRASSNGVDADVIELVVPQGDSDALESNDDKAKLRRRLFFNRDTKLILMETNEIWSNLSNSLATTYYSDFKLLDGVLIPAKIRIEQNIVSNAKIMMMGVSTAETKITRVTDITINALEINPTFNEKTFDVSAGKSIR